MALLPPIDDPIWSAFDCDDNDDDVVVVDKGCRFCAAKDAKLQLIDGNIVCTTCFSLNGRQLDYSAEWRYYGQEDMRAANPARCSPALAGSSQVPVLGSIVSRGPRKVCSNWSKKTEKSSDAESQKLDTGRQMQRFQLWNTLSYKDRVMNSVWNTMIVNMSHEGMPNIILEEAKSIYQRLAAERITRGSRREGVIAASVYMACKRCDVPRSIREIADMFGIRMDVMTRAHRLIDDVLGGDNTMTSSEPCHFVGRFCSKLEMPQGLTDIVRRLVEYTEANSIIYDAMPTSIVAGTILYVIGAMRKDPEYVSVILPSNEQISSVCQVASTTMSKIMKRIQAHPEYEKMLRQPT